jgi:glycosyltransferase involved in cell wall biosynthesis
MAVVSDLATDARVQREAQALAVAGHDVTVVGFSYSGPPCDVGHLRYVKLAFPSRASTRTRRLTGAALYIVTASLVILRHRADVYHSHNIHLALPLALSARLRRARFVYDAHELTGEMFRPPLKQLVTGIERRFWRRADVTITTNASPRR